MTVFFGVMRGEDKPLDVKYGIETRCVLSCAKMSCRRSNKCPDSHSITLKITLKRRYIKVFPYIEYREKDFKF